MWKSNNEQLTKSLFAVLHAIHLPIKMTAPIQNCILSKSLHCKNDTVNHTTAKTT